MTDLELNLSRFCVLLFCSAVFFFRAHGFRGRPNALMGIRVTYLLCALGIFFAALCAFFLGRAAFEYLQ